jgi:hypothetical protein
MRKNEGGEKNFTAPMLQFAPAAPACTYLCSLLTQARFKCDQKCCNSVQPRIPSKVGSRAASLLFSSDGDGGRLPSGNERGSI